MPFLRCKPREPCRGDLPGGIRGEQVENEVRETVRKGECGGERGKTDDHVTPLETAQQKHRHVSVGSAHTPGRESVVVRFIW